MQEESTTHLNKILNNNITLDQINRFITDNQKELPDSSIFSEYMAKHPEFTPTLIYKNCKGLFSKSYIYEILSGKKKNPSRDITITICIAANMDRKMTRRILENYGHRDLYPKDKRDIIIATYINNKNYSIDTINDELAKYNLRTLGSKT